MIIREMKRKSERDEGSRERVRKTKRERERDTKRKSERETEGERVREIRRKIDKEKE